ncbi:MAG: class I SAM-dependent methyltransferase [Propionibacteriaceae bacterium]
MVMSSAGRDGGIPATRWELADPGAHGYGRRFARLIADGSDIDGEARLADCLVPRNARILDAGAGMGRVGAALQRRGHRVVAVEKDPELVEQARRTYPDLALVESDLLGLSGRLLTEHGAPGEFDLVVVVGNVLILLAPDSERRVLATLASLLAPDGRILTGFSTTAGPANSRTYPPDEFAADVEASGLAIQLQAGSYDLRPAGDDYVVSVLSRADSR